MKPGLDGIEAPIHLVGIGGTGMSPIAELLAARGIATRGSDIAENTGTKRLTALGIPVTIGHSADALGDARTLVVSSAITESNEELIAARSRGIPVLHRSDVLHALMKGKRAITIAGTHGKTTTTALVCHMLTEMGLDPSAAVGGAMVSIGSPARCGNGPYFVAEADESDGSFLKYTPEIAVLNNVDYDHMDHFKTRENLEAAFVRYLGNTRKEGVSIVGWDSPLAREVASRHNGNRLTFGLVLGSEIRAIDYACRDGFSRFKAIVERDVIPVELHAIGKHNVFNALATLAVARALRLDVRRAAETLRTFRGVERRLAPVVETDDLKIFDDYGHNPGKTAAAVGALKESWPDWHLIVVYQPHRYSRLDHMYDEMLGGIGGADEGILLPVYAAGEIPTRDYPVESLASDASRITAMPVTAASDIDHAVTLLRAKIRPRTIVLSLGAGNVWMVSERLKNELSSSTRQGGLS